MDISKITVENICAALEKYNLPVFRNDEKNYNINNGYIRSSDLTPNVFNDIAYIFWWYKGNLHFILHTCTTDPGLYYLGNKTLSKLGTGIIKSNQSWKAQLGMHKGYPALVQADKITVYRDFDRDGELDIHSLTGLDLTKKRRNNIIMYYKDGKHVATLENTYDNGFNQHAAQATPIGHLDLKNAEKVHVNGWSAGCLVRNNVFEYLMALNVWRNAVINHGNTITTSLLDEIDVI